MRIPAHERGAALLTVLLLLAVMATVSATALDRLTLATRLAGNAAQAAQARQWLGMAEQLAAVRLEDMLAADAAQTTLAGGWLGVRRTIDLPDGARVTARVQDGGNCFNLNSLAAETAEGLRIVRPSAIAQFTALMTSLGIDAGAAARIAASSADWIDSDSQPQPGGTESGSVMVANHAFTDEVELGRVAGMMPAIQATLRPWVCALPTHDPSPINVNTLTPEQGPLLAMLAPAQIGLDRARSVLAQRPAAGFGSVVGFWQSPGLKNLTIAPDAAEQVKVRSSFFRLHAQVGSTDQFVWQTALLQARDGKVRLVRRAWTSGE